MAGPGLSPAEVANPRPPGKKGGWPRLPSGRAAGAPPGLSSRTVPPRAAADGRSEGRSGVRGPAEAGAAGGRRGDGAWREVAVKPAGRSNAVAAAAGAWAGRGVASAQGAGSAAAREERGSGGGWLTRKRRPDSAALPPPKRRAVSATGQRGAPPPTAGSGGDYLPLGRPSSLRFRVPENAPSMERGLHFEAAPAFTPTMDTIRHDSTHGRDEGGVGAIATTKASMGRFPDEKMGGNTLQRKGKSVAWAVSGDVKMVNKLGRSKIVLPPFNGSQKSPRYALDRSFSKDKEKSAAAIRESLAHRKPLKVKGLARSNHLPLSVASTSALVTKGKLQCKVATILGDDGILKALAIHDGKIEWDHDVLARVPPLSADVRAAIRMKCRMFHSIYRFIVRAVERGSLKVPRVDFEADRVIKELPDVIKHEPIVGNVPGIEIGDEFLYRAELALVGLHLPYMGGIGMGKDANGVRIAVSIIASGRYPDKLSASGELIYIGSGGKLAGKKPDEDQKLKRGNLALKNCIETKTPVRVVHGYKGRDNHSRAKHISTYTYGGLYLVVDFCRGDLLGSRVFKYRLRRIPGQPELPMRIAERLMKSQVRPGICIDDISQGKEEIPICVVNDVDNARPTPFKYITGMKYPSLPTKRLPWGCGCINGCSDCASCTCASKNGGDIPFNFNGAAVHKKPLIFECGPSCKCPRSCPNRVSQRGGKIPLEVFRTAKKGWGVRSLWSISAGTFICEYVGELLHDKEADQRMDDQYLFEIGRNYNGEDLWKALPSTPGMSSGPSSQAMEDVGFVIHAGEFGNIGRFINRSCSPNLYVQNVLWDHDDDRMPHVMFFAADNIPPLQELTYDYKCKMTSVGTLSLRNAVGSSM